MGAISYDTIVRADPAWRVLATDQRGVARDVAACDVGAYEYEEVWRVYLPVMIR